MSVVPWRASATELTFQTAAPMFAASPALEIVLWNEGAEALLGFTSREVLGKRCYEVLGCQGAARRLRCGRCGGRSAASGECAPAFQSQISTRSGERIWVSVTMLLAASAKDPPLRVHLLQELRRQRQLEELLRQVVTAASRVSSLAAWHDEAARRGVRFPAWLTTREREVIRLLAHGFSTAEIAGELGVTPRTARNHIQNILGKLRVHSRLEAVAYASERGLV